MASLFSFMPVAADVLGGFMSLMGGSNAASAARLNGERQRAAAQFTAAQMRQQAGQSVATGQRQALEMQRQGKLIESRILALTAAGGGGVTDKTIVELIGRTRGESSYRAAVALYQGEDRARTLRMSAAAKEYEGLLMEEAGEAQAEAYEISGVMGMLKGTSSLFAKYGQGGVSSGVADDPTNYRDS